MMPSNDQAPILAIESSCDETAVAILRAPGIVLSSLIASQAELHARFGGVRLGTEDILQVVHSSIEDRRALIHAPVHRHVVLDDPDVQVRDPAVAEKRPQEHGNYRNAHREDLRIGHHWTPFPHSSRSCKMKES